MRKQELDFSIDLMRALLWQYNDAENLQAIIQQKQDWYEINQQEFWINWVRDVFDLRTANEFGLSVWAIILNIPIIVQVEPPASPDLPFGMDATDGNFEHSNFARDAYSVQTLTTEQARTVLMMRYHQITSDGSVVFTNQFYKDFFGGRVYVTDNLDMTVTYTINFTPAARISYILRNYDILPRPAGVEIASISVAPKIPFGFGIDNENFDNSNFIGED